MKCPKRFPIRIPSAAFVLALSPLSLPAQVQTNSAPPRDLAAALLSANPAATNEGVYPIDLPTALRLAGARNLDIQLAREALNEARANHLSALEQFFPWLAPAVTYNRGDGAVQNVPPGTLPSAHYQFYNPGAALTAQVDLGDAIYDSLAAKQLVKASDHALAAQRQEALLSAAQAYFDLAKAGALLAVVGQAIQVSEDYQQQLHEAVGAGIAFRGDELRVQTQTEQDRIALEQARERARVAGVNLARVLHLDARVVLAPLDPGLAPLALFPTNASLNSLVEQALRARPELKQSQALLAASRAARNGALYGPLFPSVGGLASAGGLGGGPDGGPSTTLTGERNYTVGLSWRIGPGGLFDSGRIRATKSRLASAELAEAELKDAIISQVVASHVHVGATATQIHLAEANLATATQTLALTRQRKQYGVGLVLEDLQAQQALTQARSNYVTAVAEHDKAQYTLNQAVGGLQGAE